MRVAAGECVALLGANGAGKTSLLRAISGAINVLEGKIRLSDRSIRGLKPHQIARLGIAHVPEGRCIFPGPSVFENLQVGAAASMHKVTRDDSRLEGVLQLFPWMRARLGVAGGSLSGGQQQMLAIARALMASPRVIMLDEPSLGLAPKVVDDVFAALRTIKQQGIAILLVEQSAPRALALAERGYVMNRGTVVLEGASEELLQDARLPSAYLG
jgi:branched-chain amino acid transport system ATP-binding protein